MLAVNSPRQKERLLKKLENQNKELVAEIVTVLPIIKLSEGRYLVGSEVKSIQLKGENGCVVRTGGGFMILQEYLERYAKNEFFKLGLVITKGKMTYKATILDLIQRHRETEQAAKEFKKSCPEEGIDAQVKSLMERTKKLDEKLEKIRQKTNL